MTTRQSLEYNASGGIYMIKTFTCKNCQKEFQKETRSYAYYCDECRKIINRKNALAHAYRTGRIKKPGVGSGGNQWGENNHMWSGFKGEYSYKNIKDLPQQCELCNTTINLCVHHKDKDRHNNSRDNLVVLCRSCHSKIHKLYLNFKITSRSKTSLIQGNSRTDNPEPSLVTKEGATIIPDECKGVGSSDPKCEATEM